MGALLIFMWWCIIQITIGDVTYLYVGVVNLWYIDFVNLEDYWSIIVQESRIITHKYLLEKLKLDGFIWPIHIFKVGNLSFILFHKTMQNLPILKYILKIIKNWKPLWLLISTNIFFFLHAMSMSSISSLEGHGK
jgi:hypothetical protein